MQYNLRYIRDTLANFVSGLGIVGRDKNMSTQFYFNELSQGQLEYAYRGDWVARKCINIPANDATREWRAWQADEKQIEVLEEAERVLDVRGKLRRALVKSRLYGGAALVIGVNDGADPEMPLNLNAVKKDSLKFVHAVSRYEIQAAELERDLREPTFGQPKYYQRSMPDGRQLRLHPSRVVRLLGNEVPNEWQVAEGWGDSILQAVNDALQNVGLTTQAVATMVHEAKFDVIKVPKLAQALETEESTTRLTERFQYANVAKSIVNTIIIDAEEEWQRVSTSFAGLPDILKLYIMIASGAVDIPTTRFLGQSPQGLSATGESDMRNYYDHVRSDQNNVLRPAIAQLDEVIIRSALGDRPEDVHYEWNSLWQLDDVQKAALAKSKADTFRIDLDSGLFGEETLRQARINQIIEDGTYPNFEVIEPEDEDNDPFLAATPEQEQAKLEAQAALRAPPKQITKDAHVEDYDPNQKRDEYGRWTETGGHANTTNVKLTPAEINAVEYYSSIGYQPINKGLRKGRKNFGALEKKSISGLDRVVSRSKLTKDVKVYRGVDGDFHSQLMDMVEGTILHDKGFMSTTPSRMVASNFGGVIEIVAKRGQNAAYTGRWSGDKEVLFPRGTKLRLVDNSKKIIRFEVVR